jgi:hypothetical protein
LLHARGIINYESAIALPEPIRLALRGKLKNMGLSHGVLIETLNRFASRDQLQDFIKRNEAGPYKDDPDMRRAVMDCRTWLAAKDQKAASTKTAAAE